MKKIIILSDWLNKAFSTYEALQDIEADLYILCVNQPHDSKVAFKARTWRFFMHGPWNRRLLLMSLLFRGKLKCVFGGLNTAETMSWLDKIKPDIGLHSVGGIYRKNFINKFSAGIINPHIGKLPKYRGRCVMEWSILYGDPTGVTSFFIDEGIDTGEKVIKFFPFTPDMTKGIDHAKAQLFAQDINIFKQSIQMYLAPDFTHSINNISCGKRFYVMSDLLKEVVLQSMKKTED